MVRKSGQLTRLECRALEHFAQGPAERPKGAGTVLIANLVYHGWIIRVEREFDFGPELYKTTPEGDAALAADKALEDSK